MSHLVSIVIPTRNRRMFLAQAIDSCLKQTYGVLEVIVVDDASEDGTEDFVRGLDDARVIYMKQARPQGSVAAINRGFAAAKGAYLTWSSDDDYYAPEAIATMAAALDADQGVDFVYTHYWMVDVAGKVLHPARVEDPDGLETDNYVGHCFLYRRKVYEAIGDYDAEPFLAEEYRYWLRVRCKFGMKRLPVPLYYHRVHPAALTSFHGVDKMQAAIALARKPFIPAWKHHFLVARGHYHAGRRAASLGHALVCVCLKPWHGPAWRLIVLGVLSRAGVDLLKGGRG